MDNNSKEKNKSLRRAMTAEKLTEMLREIDISAAVESSGSLNQSTASSIVFPPRTFLLINLSFNSISSASTEKVMSHISLAFAQIPLSASQLPSIRRISPETFFISSETS